MSKCNSCYYLNNIDLQGSFYEVRFLSINPRALSDNSRSAAKIKNSINSGKKTGGEAEANWLDRKAEA
jgi:hypothetical protein